MGLQQRLRNLGYYNDEDGKERGKILTTDDNGLPCTLADEHVSIKDLSAIPLVKKASGDWEYVNVVQGVRALRCAEVRAAD